MLHLFCNLADRAVLSPRDAVEGRRQEEHRAYAPL